MFDKIYIGQRTGELEIGNRPQKISRVTLLVYSDHAYTVGNDSGREIEVTCPWGSQRMAQSILDRVSSYDFLPYSATDALLNPASEIGDGVTIGGIYSIISSSEIGFDKMCSANISESGTDEIDDEYPYESRQRREFTRKLAYTRSLITKTAEEIRLEVQAAGNRISALSVTVDGISTRVSSAEGNISTLQQTAGSLTTRISSAEGNISSISQYVDSITLSVSNGDPSSTIQLKAGNAVIESQKIEMSGVVTFTGLEAGETTINGAWLETGTVMASKLIGSTVGLLDGDEKRVGGLMIGETEDGPGIELYTNYGGIRLSSSGNFWVAADYGSFGLTSSGLVSKADVAPESGSSYSLGLSGKRWTDVYADNDKIVTSDLQVKKDVVYDLGQYEQFFDSLKPMSFIFVNGKSGRRHMGFGAQDVEKTLEEVGISTKDFAGFVKSPVVDDYGKLIENKWEYALRYGEWIPLFVDQIQKLKKRVSELEKKEVYN